MQALLHKIRPLACCSLLSILVHLLLVSSMRMMGRYDFSAPVNQPFVMVDLAAASAPVIPAGGKVSAPDEPVVEAPAADGPLQERETPAAASAISGPSRVDLEPKPEPKPEPRPEPKPEPRPEPKPEPRPEPSSTSVTVARTEVDGAADRSAKAKLAPAEEARRAATAIPASTMLTTVSEFLAPKYEKLTYLITMHGIPIGSAELESRNEKGVTAITLRLKSNAATSTFFPVNDEIETRHIDGMFIMTKIKQQEGSFRNEESFTINVRKKTVSWFDLGATTRTSTISVPTADVLDTLSGIYYLRNRRLQVGKTETLHIYDSETYADVPVEILRREEVRLSNWTKVDTLVVRPLQKTAGIFRRTGDVLIWMTDDDFKVPVRIATSIALGKVTAELISAESKPHAEEGKEISR